MNSPRVVIVDYELGNLYSVQRACRFNGLDAEIITDPNLLHSADGIILPGVGAMPDAVQTLEERGLDDALRQCVTRGTPVFGICLGMQLLFAEGSEFGPHAGLGIIQGRVVHFHNEVHGRKLRVPHIGWNAVLPKDADPTRWQNSPLRYAQPGEPMYFVHSYHVVPEDPTITLAVARYGDVEFCAAIQQDNVFACQFHPERSGPAGLDMYRAFKEAVALHVQLSVSGEEQ
jgi:glutamine amidotransferase